MTCLPFLYIKSTVFGLKNCCIVPCLCMSFSVVRVPSFPKCNVLESRSALQRALCLDSDVRGLGPHDKQIMGPVNHCCPANHQRQRWTPSTAQSLCSHRVIICAQKSMIPTLTVPDKTFHTHPTPGLNQQVFRHCWKISILKDQSGTGHDM